MPSHGYRLLACEIIWQSFLDLKVKARMGGRHFKLRQETISFLHSEWFETLCGGVLLDPSYVRKCMLEAGRGIHSSSC